MNAVVEKSPFNPSKKATARVKDPFPAPETCHYCGGDVAIVNNSVIYGRSYGDYPWAYLCQTCNAYVGMHPYTNIPLGTLADKETREARKRAKPLFEALFKEGHVDRTQAYQLLAERMNLTSAQTHFGLFTVEQCEQAIGAVGAIKKQLLQSKWGKK